MSRAEREYDRKRKQDTLEALKKGFNQLKRQKAYKDKPITKYALSKQTGIANQTINNYPEIMHLLEQEKKQVEVIETPYGKKEISSIEEALAVIKKIASDYNQLLFDVKEAKKINTSLSLTIAKQKNELKRMQIIIDRYEGGL